MAELVDSSERKRNDSKSDYAPVYLRFSLFPIIYCVLGDAWEGRPYCSKYLFEGPATIPFETPFFGS